MERGQGVLWRGVVLAALLFALAECDMEGKNEHAQSDRKEVMLDPTANISKWK